MKGLVKLAVAAAVAGSAAVGMTAPAWASVSSFETLPGGTLHVVSTSSGITHTNVISNYPSDPCKAGNPAHPGDPCRNPNITISPEGG